MATMLGIRSEGTRSPKVVQLEERARRPGRARHTGVRGQLQPAAGPGDLRGAGYHPGTALVTTSKNEETRVRIEENVCAPTSSSSSPLSPGRSSHHGAPVDDRRLAPGVCRPSDCGHPLLRVRQARKEDGRPGADLAKLVANLIATAGADRVVCLRPARRAIEGFFDIPVDHLRANPIMADAFQRLRS